MGSPSEGHEDGQGVLKKKVASEEARKPAHEAKESTAKESAEHDAKAREISSRLTTGKGADVPMSDIKPLRDRPEMQKALQQVDKQAEKEHERNKARAWQPNPKESEHMRSQLEKATKDDPKFGKFMQAMAEGKQKSDKQLRADLGVSQNDLVKYGHQARTMLNIHVSQRIKNGVKDRLAHLYKDGSPPAKKQPTYDVAGRSHGQRIRGVSID